jgi:hypothetical protein
VAEILNKPTIPAAVTNTSELINDGEDGVNPFITAADLPTTVTSVGLTMPSAFNVANSPITSAGTLAVTGAGVVSQYVRGDGSLANFPTSTGGGASVSYYLNGSVSQGTIGGVAYKEINGVPVIGTGTDFTINADGYIAQFITDVGDPNKLLIPAGNWNFETYFSASSGGGSPRFYIELYKYDGSTFTLISSNSATPEYITGGTSIDLYFTALAIPTTTLLATDRLAVRFYVIHSGRTITMHTENSHLSQIITTFSTGLTALNGLTTQVQSFATGTSGTDFGISSATSTHTFNLPTASATNRGALSTTDWSTFNGKFNLPSLTSGSVLFSNGTTIAQDNANLFWDDTNNRLGIGTATPTHGLNVYTTVADTGILLDSNTNPSFIIKRGGVERLKLTASGSIGTVNGLGNGLVFQTDSVERMRFSTAGNVGIGESVPTAKLHIKAPGALSTDIALRVRNSADTADLLITNGLGNVGIGTSTPNQKLEVIGNAIFRSTQRIDINTAQTAVVGVLAGSSIGTYGNFSLISSSGTAGENIDISYWNGGTYCPAFRIANVASGFSNLLLMKDGGNVGIGTTTPTAKLHIKAPGALSTDIALRVRNSADTVNLLDVNGTGVITQSSLYNLNGTFSLNTTDTATNDYGPVLTFAGNYTGTTPVNFGMIRAAKSSVGGQRGYMSFHTGASGANLTTESMRINWNNNILIGTIVDQGGRLQVKAPGALSTDIALRVRNSADTADLMTVNGAGTAIIKGASTDFYVNSNSALNSTGRFVILNHTGSSSPLGYVIQRLGSELVKLTSDDGTGNLILQNSWSNYGMEFNTAGANTRMFISGVLGNIGIGTTAPAASAKLDVTSTTQGFLPPRMTNAQRLAIATPAVGLCVYCTDVVEGLYINKSTGWTYIG